MEYFKKAIEIINTSKGMPSVRKLEELLTEPLQKDQYNINQQADIDGNTLLHHAVRRNDVRVLNYLLSQSASLVVKNNEGFNSFQLAILEGGCLVAQFLLVYINDSSKDKLFRQELINGGLLAIFYQYQKFILGEAKDKTAVNLLKPLIAAGANVNLVVSTESKTSLLHLAVSLDNESANITNTLIAAKANVNVVNNDGDTPLHIAAKDFLYDHIKALMLKTNLNIINNDGNTPLYCLIAALTNHGKLTFEECFIGLSLIIQFIVAGASLTIKNQDSKTALQLYDEFEYLTVSTQKNLFNVVKYLRVLLNQKAYLELDLEYKKLLQMDWKNAIDETMRKKLNNLLSKLKPVRLPRYQFFHLPVVNSLQHEQAEEDIFTVNSRTMFK